MIIDAIAVPLKGLLMRLTWKKLNGYLIFTGLDQVRGLAIAGIPVMHEDVRIQSEKDASGTACEAANNLATDLIFFGPIASPAAPWDCIQRGCAKE